MEAMTPLWWQDGVIYQIYPRSFRDASGDGIGDLRGITERLDYVAETLGVDAIWLSPFYPSPMADFGYDVADYVDVDPMFGDLADFDSLVREAHRRGLRIIVDFVPNHSSDRHPWFLESRSSRDSAKRDWYIWRDGRSGGSAPNNWLSHFGGSAWEWDERTGQYYLHSFLKEQPDLNWRNPAVEHAMLDVLRFWLERGVDGFRIDVAHLILKDPDLRDNPPNPAAPPTGTRFHEYGSQLHVYDKAHADVHGAFRRIRALLDTYSAEAPRMAVGEIHEFDPTVWASYYGRQLDELHMPFNFGLIFTQWSAANVRAIVDTLEAALPAGAWPNYVLGNHDEHRVVSRIGAAQARVGMMLLLTLRGTPTIYYGDEIGMHDAPVPPELVQDPFEKRMPGVGLGRDPERSPMQWSDEPNAGFCPPGVQPWLPVAADHGEVNVAKEHDLPDSMLSFTRALLRLRRSTPALRHGSYRPVDGTPEDCFLYVREGDGARFLIALNFSPGVRKFAVPDLTWGQIVLSTHVDREEPANLCDLSLHPNEGCIILLEAEQP